jgi:hypothetical protein
MGASGHAYFGFDRIWGRMQNVVLSEEGPNEAVGVLKVLSKRLEGAGDLELVAQRWVQEYSDRAVVLMSSLGLLNALLRSAQQERSPSYHELIIMIEMLNIRRYVSASSPPIARRLKLTE